MSFFDDPNDGTDNGGGGGGDIWSTGAFAFDSPLKDLLDSRTYTLENLLAEDELLQELRGMHPQLIDYFATEEAVAGLLRHLVGVPPPPPPCPIARARELAESSRRERENSLAEEAERALMDDPDPPCVSDDVATRILNDEISRADFCDPSIAVQGEDVTVTGGAGMAVVAVAVAVAVAVNENEEEEEPLPYPDDESDDPNAAAVVPTAAVVGAAAVAAEEEEDEEEEIDAPDDETDANDGKEGGGGDSSDSDAQQQQRREHEEEGEDKPPSEKAEAEAAAALEPGQWMLGGRGGDERGDENIIEGAIDSDEQIRADREAYDLLYIRYPYMACEVICCEVGDILNILVEGRVPLVEEAEENQKGAEEEKTEEQGEGGSDDEGAAATDTEIPDTDIEDAERQQQKTGDEDNEPRQSLLDLFFTMLTETPALTLDDRRAGYLEKILTVLFRTRPGAMTAYLNNGTSAGGMGRPTTRKSSSSGGGGGPALLRAFLNHLHSHSVMQIVQRLMLPPPPGRGGLRMDGGMMDGNDDDDNDNDGSESKDDDDDDDNHSPAFGGAGGWPMISSGVEDDEDDEDDDDDLLAGPAGLVRCNWSENVDAVGWLLDRLTGEEEAAAASAAASASAATSAAITTAGDGKDAVEGSCGGAAADYSGGEKMEDALLDASQNASEVLVAVVQNSPLTSATVRTLSSEPALGRVIDAVCSVSSSVGDKDGDDGGCGGGDEGSNGGEFVMSESTVTLAMSVLESLVLQLGGYGAVVTPIPDDVPDDDDDDVDVVDGHAKGVGGELDEDDDGALIVPEDSDADPARIRPAVARAPSRISSSPKLASADVLIAYLPRLLQTLSTLLRHPTTESWLLSVQYSTELHQVLGSARLRIVRLIESLVLLGNTAVDELLCDSPALESCLDLFWAFPWCSMLHQSVANLLVHVLEGGLDRVELQRYFLNRCDLMGRLMASFDGIGTNEAAASGEAWAGSATSSAAQSSPPLEGEGPNQPRYSEVMFALKEYRSQESTSSVDSERGSSVSSADEDEDEEAVDEDVLPVSDDDVEAAIERQREKVQDMGVSASAGCDSMEDAEVGDRKNTTQVDGESIPVEPSEGRNAEIQPPPSTSAPAPKPKQAEFRMGYMGHVIIVCQALVHACTVNLVRDQHQENCGDEGEEDVDSFDAEIEAAVLPDMNGEIEPSSSSLEVVLKGEEKEEEMEEDEQGQVLISKKRKDRSFDEDDGSKSSRRHDSEQTDLSQEVEEQADDDDELISSHRMDSDQLPDASFPSRLQQQEEQEQEDQSRPPIAHLMQTHPLYDTWQSFVTTTLASETAVQSTPLGGYGTSQQEEMNGDSHPHGQQQHRVSLTDEDLKNFMGVEHSDGVAGTVVAGAGGSPIDLDDADLDIAASMMEALSLPPGSGGAAGTAGEDGAGGPGHHRQHRVMAGFGAVVQVAPTQGSASATTGAGQYLYDDPLGGGSEFDDDDDSDGEEEGGDTTADAQKEQANIEPGGRADDEEDEEDAPVIDLFAGNFSFDGPTASPSGNGESGPGSEEGGGGGQGWANFANFDDAFAASAIPEPTPIAPSAKDSTSDVEFESQEVADVFSSTPHLVDALADSDDTSR